MQLATLLVFKWIDGVPVKPDWKASLYEIGDKRNYVYFKIMFLINQRPATFT